MNDVRSQLLALLLIGRKRAGELRPPRFFNHHSFWRFWPFDFADVAAHLDTRRRGGRAVRANDELYKKSKKK